VPFDTAIQQWRSGELHVDQAPREQQATLRRVEEALVSELRRRLGGTFAVDELAELYDAGTSWCLDVAARTAPTAPWSWDARVADAAFARYAREAVDFAGGRRLPAS
jgi:hypothetical protein